MTVSLESQRRRLRRQAVLGVTFFVLFQLACAAIFAALCL